MNFKRKDCIIHVPSGYIPGMNEWITYASKELRKQQKYSALRLQSLFICSFQVRTKNWETAHAQVLRTECCSVELPLRVGVICTVKNVSSIHGFMVYAVRMSPAFDKRSAIQRFKCTNVNETCNRIMFDFCPGLPYMVIHCTHSTVTHTFFSQHWKKQGPLNSRVTNSTSNKSLKKP